MASQITSLAIVYSTVYSGANQRKHQSSASLAFGRETHWWPTNSPHKWQVTRTMFPFDDVIMWTDFIRSIIFPVFQNNKITGYLYNITSTVARWHCSWAAVTPDKYERDSKYLNPTFAKSKFAVTEKLMNEAFVTPTQALPTNDDVMARNCVPHYRPHEKGIHLSPVHSPDKAPVTPLTSGLPLQRASSSGFDVTSLKTKE